MTKEMKVKKILFAALSAAFFVASVGIAPTFADTATAGARSGAFAGSSSGGNVTNINGGPAAKIPAETPGTIVAPVAPPQLFGAAGVTSAERGIALTLWYNDTCGPVATRDNVLQEQEALGSSYTDKHSPSYETNISFSPTQYLRSEATKGTTGYSEVQEVMSSRVLFHIPQGKFTCLGLMTITSKNGQSAPLSAIISDARHYVFDNGVFEGFKNIELISLPGTVGNAGGVVNESTGFSLGPALSIAGSAAAGVVGIGISHTSGEAGKVARLGFTALVVSDTTKDRENLISQEDWDRLNVLYRK